MVIVAALLALLTPALGPGAAGTGVGHVPPLATIDKLDPELKLDGPAERSVIVQAVPGRAAAVRSAVERAGGTVGKDLPLVHGFQAEVPVPALADLVRSPAVRSVTVDRQVQFQETSYDATATASNFAKVSGATAAWAQNRLGAGVGVAVLDTGISQMNDFKSRVVFGPDLSGEGTTVDTYGHGTVMAGVIGGSGADTATQASGAYTGVAPKSTLVSVKLAGRNGAVDVSTVLQGMHWVSAYKDQFNIRVVNISFGVPSKQSPAVDPLNYAVQRLWRQGIVVVVAAGNSGPSEGTVMKPGDDPVAITVGGMDDKQNLDPADDSISSWSSRGSSTLAKPDVVASGRTLIASRSFGSKVEADNPKALVSPSYIKGSGTSQAAAVVSGLSALLLEARPDLTPDQVKAILKGTASPLPGFSATAQGAGRVQLGAALTAPAGPAGWQTASSTGLGSLEQSRGGWRVDADCNGDGIRETVVSGEIDVRCEPWNGTAWTGTAWTGTAWTGTAWTGTAWTGTAWTGSAWTGTAWTGTAWTGGVWTGTAWTGTAWTGTAWTGTAWTGTAWTGTAWTGSAWTGTAWTGTAWTGTAWTGSAWTGAVYGDDDVFLTAFWGPRPPAGVYLPGEVYTPLPGRGRLR